ncbi:MAG: hypothetical protein WCW77_02485 [Patescibacteria group bacterium]|jgi:hypothetical protein
MLNPTLTQRKNENKTTIDERAKKLFGVIYDEKEKVEPENDEPKIKVSALISKMAFFYEKIRYSVDYKDEHLLRKYSIERNLKRQLVIQGSIEKRKAGEVARLLLTELIRADYLPNNKIPETKIDEIAEVINKYMKLNAYSLKSGRLKDKKGLTGWIIGIAASEIEERLGRTLSQETLINYMYEILNKDIIVSDQNFEKDKEIQIYLGINRNYFRFDRNMMEFILFKYFNEGWGAPGDEQIAKIANNLEFLKEAIGYQIDHPLSARVDKVIGRYTVFFSVLTEVIEADPIGAYNKMKNEPSEFEKTIKAVCEKKYKGARSKLWRAAVRSIIYIFMTKMVLAFILEVPVTQILGQTVNAFSLAINIGFPPILLFIIVMFTSVPSDENTKKIIEGIKQITYVEFERQEPYKIRVPLKKSGSLNTFFGLIYIITFFASFGFVVWLLTEINFNFISITIFLFFLTLVSFFSLRIRKRVRELVVTDQKENFLGLLADFFYTPILAVGKWLSEKFSRMNVFVFVLDFIIEAPFKIFVELTEEWTKYVRERREELGQ